MIFNLEKDQKFSNGSTNFIPLGDHKNLALAEIKAIEAKLYLSKTEKVEEIWGTLGWKDDSLFQERGEIKFSASGQTEEAKGATLRQIEMLYDIYSEIPLKNQKVRERYIDLNELRINKPERITLNDMKELRLDIFLERNEGAVVYLQHSDKENYNDDEAFIEYISPQPTDDNNRLDLRNKLTYYIPYQFGRKLKPEGETKKDRNISGVVNFLEISEDTPINLTDEDGNVEELEETSFIIKILTFFRNSRTPEEALKSFGSAIARKNRNFLFKEQLDKAGKNKYALLKFVPNVDFNNESGQFTKIKKTDGIDFNAKTLLLIHGTFNDTYGTFDHFISKKYFGSDHNFLNYLIENNYYEQILAFDHPYFWDTPEENAQWLINFLSGQCFSSNKLDVLGASRGGLLAMYLAANLKSAYTLKVGKVLVFSGGSSGYLNSIAGLSKMISIMKLNAPPSLQKLLLGIASIGVSYLEKNSGLSSMKSGSPFLTKLYSEPLEHPVIFKAMVAEWSPHLVIEKGWIDTTIKRALAAGVDLVIKLFLGAHHDWVIGTAEQRKLPQGLNAFPEPSFEYNSRHGKYFFKGYPKRKIQSQWEDAGVYREILDYLK